MKFSFPLTQVLGASQISNFFPSSHEGDPTQQSLNENSNELQWMPKSLPLKGHSTGGFHGVRFLIGTPQQPIMSILSLGTSALTIPSINLQTQPGEKPRNLYDSSDSSTYQPNGTSITTIIYARPVEGIISQDHFQVGDLLIKDMYFEEVTKYSGPAEDWNHLDTVFSLGPYNESNPRNFISPVARLIKDEMLDENIFSLRLSRGLTDTSGQLVLGGTLDPELYEGEFTTIPTTHLPINFPPRFDLRDLEGDKWKVEISSIHLGDGSSINTTLPAHSIAVLDTAWPYMMLPDSFAKQISKLGDATRWGPFAWFDCDKRAEMPDMTFVLAGKEFVITPYDYMIEEVYDEEPGRVYCSTVFGGGFEDGGELVLLGTSFLKAWVSVWDFEEESIAFARAKHGPPNHSAPRREL